jgi:hypothetical protein
MSRTSSVRVSRHHSWAVRGLNNGWMDVRDADVCSAVFLLAMMEEVKP